MIALSVSPAGIARAGPHLTCVPALAVVLIATQRRNSSLSTRKTQQFPCGRRFLDVIRPKVLDRSSPDSMGWMKGSFARQAEPSAARPIARLGLQIG